MKQESVPPSPLSVPVVERIHGIEIKDRFRWLEDQSSMSTREFIEDEQRFFRAYLDSHHALRLKTASRVRQLLRVETRELPISDHRGGLIYRARRADEEQASLYQSDCSGHERRILSRETPGRNAFTSLTVLRVSSNGRFLAYARRQGGADQQEVAIYDLFRHRPLEDRLASGFFRGLVFDRRDKGFFYVHEEGDCAARSRHAVRYHVFGEDTRRDEEIFFCGTDPSTRLRLLDSEDGSALGYTISSLGVGAKLRFLLHQLPLAKNPEEIAVPDGTELSPRFGGFGIIASTTWLAPHGRVVFIPHADSRPDDWAELIPESECRLHGFELLGDKILVHYSDGPSVRTSIHSREGALVRKVDYPEGGTVTLGQVDPFSNQLFYAFSDVISGSTIYAVDLNSGETREWWKTAAPQWKTLPRIQHRSFVTPNGDCVPLTIVSPEAFESTRPTVLTVYGSRGAYDTPKFSAVLTVLVEAGFNYVTAHVGEVGKWSRGTERQRTTVGAVIAAARWLIENKFTTPGRLALAGQSHGALLTLCAMAERPDLFRAIVALGPIADLTRFHLFGVARWFTQELGSPEDPEDFQVLSSLSPYHRIRNGITYPAVLIISGDLDKRCDAMHARKMTAALRASKSPHPIVLDYSERRGHKPGLPLNERTDSLTDRVTFLIAELTDSQS